MSSIPLPLRPVLANPAAVAPPWQASPLRLLLASPALVFLALLFAAPIGYLFTVSLHPGGGMGRVDPGWTLANYQRFATDAYYVGILWDTFLYGLTTAVVCAVLGFPFAYFLARTSSRWRPALLFVTVVPLLVSVVIRNLGWLPILGENGLLNWLLLRTDLVEQPHQWIFNYLGAVIGMVHVQFPIMILMLSATIRKIDPAIEEAAINLGATPWQTFWRVVLPLARPGLIAGALLVFMASISALVTPGILGGKRVMLMALYINQQIRAVLNYPVGATAAMLTMVAAIVAMLVAMRLMAEKVPK